MMQNTLKNIGIIFENPLHLIVGLGLLCVLVLLPQRVDQFDFITAITTTTASESGLDTDDTTQTAIATTDTPAHTIVALLQDALKRESLFYDAPAFSETYTIGYDQQAVVLASGMQLIDNGAKYFNDPGYGGLVMTRAEAIQMLVLLRSQKMLVSFDEILYIDSVLPYKDMRRDAWYVPYVHFASEQGRLEGFEKIGGTLQPMEVLTYDDCNRLFVSLGGLSVALSNNQKNHYVTKSMFLNLLLESFDDTALKSARILRGDNAAFYTTLLQALKGKSADEQRDTIQQTVKTLQDIGYQAVFETFNYDLIGIQLLLEQSIE